MDFSNDLNLALKKSGYKKKDLADTAQISVQTVNVWLKAKAITDFRKNKLEEAFKALTGKSINEYV